MTAAWPRDRQLGHGHKHLVFLDFLKLSLLYLTRSFFFLIYRQLSGKTRGESLHTIQYARRMDRMRRRVGTRTI